MALGKETIVTFLEYSRCKDLLKRSISKVCEWGGGDCGPLLVGNNEGTLSVVTLLRQ